MKTKDEAFEFTRAQLNSYTKMNTINKYRYGEMEIKELLDYIYGEDEVPNVPEPNGPIYDYRRIRT